MPRALMKRVSGDFRQETFLNHVSMFFPRVGLALRREQEKEITAFGEPLLVPSQWRTCYPS
jgi:hypothetical protein